MEDRELLQRLDAGPTSATALARAAGISRAEIDHRIEQLRADGVEIENRPGGTLALARPLDLLDARALEAALPGRFAGGPVQLDVAWRLDSTNAELWRRPAAQGCRILLAEYQDAGRGRRGRAWSTPLAAQVSLSLGWCQDGGLARLDGLSLAAGVAVAEALHALGYARVGLKWPNDVLADGRKLAGLLLECRGGRDGPVQGVLGIGINVRLPAAAAAGIDQPWTDLAQLSDAGGPPSRNVVAATVLGRVLDALALFDRAGLAPFLPRYARLDVLSGRAVRVLAGQETIAGTAAGIAADGGLRVDTAAGERVFHAGEVSVRTQ